MLPVVIAAPECEAALRPDNLRPNIEAAPDQTLRHRGGVDRRVPDIDHIAGEQAPRLAPVGAVVVRDLARALRRRDTGYIAPRGIIVDAVGRIGHH